MADGLTQAAYCVPTPAAGSFTTIFQPALSLGLLSRRHVYTTALASEKRRGTGFRWAFASERSSADAKAAAAVAECGDYHTGLAHVMREQPTQVRTPARVAFTGAHALSLLARQLGRCHSQKHESAMPLWLN